MSRNTRPAMLHIGAITVETHDLFLAREVAAMIQAMSAPGVTEGVLPLDGKQIRWWRSSSNMNTSANAKRQRITP